MAKKKSKKTNCNIHDSAVTLGTRGGKATARKKGKSKTKSKAKVKSKSIVKSKSKSKPKTKAKKKGFFSFFGF